VDTRVCTVLGNKAASKGYASFPGTAQGRPLPRVMFRLSVNALRLELPALAIRLPQVAGASCAARLPLRDADRFSRIKQHKESFSFTTL